MRLNSGRSPVVFWDRRFTAAPSVSQLVLLCRWQSCSSLDCPELLLFAGPSSPRWWSSLHPPAKVECVKLFMEKQIKKTGKSSFGSRNLKKGHFPRQFERRKNINSDWENLTCSCRISLSFSLRNSCCFSSRLMAASSSLRSASSFACWILSVLKS